MSALIFLFFSMLEWIALILLTFSIYRFPMRDYAAQVGITALLLSIISLVLFEYLDIDILATLIQPLFVFLFFWLFFKVPVYYAGLCVVNGYLGYAAIQSIVFYVYELLGIMINPGTALAYLAQAVTAAVAFIVIGFALKYRLGFSFVTPNEITRVRLRGTNLKLLLLTFAGYGALSSFNFLYYLSDYTIIIVLLMFSAFAIIQYWTFQKEYESSHWHRTRAEMTKTPDLP
ncbi:hypothetical protein [Paenibacillus oceani]|uniref:Uncharacterized protein n=1 Tax=Paenibacillus oceani TaxID=2772510 RepID=A0A927CE35_9BACL|nr:hypothetical protein [Paenibacillus oceani]MBD2864266.1 hypothetical protein [Paenibacillus oceani]